MSMTAKVENYCMQHRFGTKQIFVDGGTRACIHCVWYEQWYHPNRGNIHNWVPTCFGFCLKHEHQRGALRRPCKDYETTEKPPLSSGL